MERSLLSGGYTAIATYDEAIIEHAIAFTKAKNVPRDRFEFQMLYGGRPGLQERWRVVDSRCWWPPPTEVSGIPSSCAVSPSGRQMCCFSSETS